MIWEQFVKFIILRLRLPAGICRYLRLSVGNMPVPRYLYLFPGKVWHCLWLARFRHSVSKV